MLLTNRHGPRTTIYTVDEQTNRTYFKSIQDAKAELESKKLLKKSQKSKQVVEASTDENLRQLSQAKLRNLLAAQQTISRSPIMKLLPDGGAKVLQKIKQIEDALLFVQKVDELVENVELDLSRLTIDDDNVHKVNFRQNTYLSARKYRLAYHYWKASTSLIPLPERFNFVGNTTGLLADCSNP